VQHGPPPAKRVFALEAAGFSPGGWTLLSGRADSSLREGGFFSPGERTLLSGREIFWVRQRNLPGPGKKLFSSGTKTIFFRGKNYFYPRYIYYCPVWRKNSHWQPVSALLLPFVLFGGKRPWITGRGRASGNRLLIIGIGKVQLKMASKQVEQDS